MADKHGDFASRAVGGVAGGVAGFATRKVMGTVWKKTTGKEPPTHPEDPDVALIEALSWAVVMGVAMSVARLVAIRLATKRLQAPASNKTEVAAAKDSGKG